MRVFTASLSCETNTFSPIPTGLASFRERAYYPRGTHPERLLHCAGPLWAARLRQHELGWELIEGLVASAMPGGTTTRLAYETLRDELLADLAAALPVAIVLLGLHGAMVADGYDDCEGDLLRRVRALTGPGTVVGATLDPHCHLSAEMTAHADVLVCFKEYPHTDILERAHELVDLCAAQAAGRITPVASVADCAMIAVMHTHREPMRGFVDRLAAHERRPGILSVSVVHGFPWGDVPDMGTRVLVYSDGDAGRGLQLARQLADELCALRTQLREEGVDIDAALDDALSGAGPVVLADSADNAGGGAPGDSTFVLRRLLERRIGGAALGPLWDPMAVRLAFDAGVGARLPMRIGGKVAPVSGSPVDAMCTVLALRADMWMGGLAGTSAPLGDCALVDAGGVLVVLASVRCQGLDTDLFTQLGCDLAALQIVVVKSSQHFHASFSKIATKTIYVDTPGALCMKLDSLPYRKIQRPKWPLSPA
jgi:microcystin degradation protein MlrC